MSTLIEEVTMALNNTKERGVADQSLLNSLEALSSTYRGYVEKWLISRNTKVNIYFYYAARNAQIVVQRTKERFASANDSDEIRRTVDLALQTIVILGQVLELVMVEKPDEAATKSVIEQAKRLRAVATETHILQSPERALEDVDKLLNYMLKLRK